MTALNSEKLGLAGGRRVDGQRVSKHRLARVVVSTGHVEFEWNATSAPPPLVRALRRDFLTFYELETPLLPVFSGVQGFLYHVGRRRSR